MGTSAAKRQQWVCFGNGAQTDQPMEIYDKYGGANTQGNKKQIIHLKQFMFGFKYIFSINYYLNIIVLYN